MDRLLRLARRALWPALLVAAIALVAWFRFLRPVEVLATRVDRGSVTETAFGRGTVESQREAAVGFDLVGRLSEILVDEGDRVVRGQELARLETNQTAADLQTARSSVSASRAALTRLAAEEVRVRALVDAAERDADRVRRLVETGALAGQAGDDAEDKLRIARADLDRVLGQRSEATRAIEVASSGAAQRQVTMLRATLLAPFDGLVIRRPHEPGDTVAIGATVLRIADTGAVFVRASLDEAVLPRLALGQRAAIQFPGARAAEAGHVTRIAWEADRQTHEILVEVTPDRLERRIALGQRADVRIQLAQREGAVRVPIAMLHRDARGPFVYVDREGRIAVARPTLGATGEDHVEVLAGLAEGDRLLAAARPGASLPTGRRWKAR